MTSVTCPYCDKEYDLDLVDDAESPSVSRSDSIDRPSGTVICSEDHVFYLLY
jgi:hypothetical protein